MLPSPPTAVVRSLLVVAIVLLLASVTAAQINVVRDLGCRLDDWTFDNGPILNAAFAKVGEAGRQGLNEEFYLPGGALVFKTPLVLPRKTGMAIRGNGITLGLQEGAYHTARGVGGSASRLVYIGPPDQPAITYRGVGLRLDGVVLQRGEYPHPPAAPVRDGSIGLRIEGYNGLPTGKLVAPQMAILSFDTAIHISDKPREKHADQNQFGYLWIQNCWTVFRSDNRQSVGNQFQFLAVGGNCDTVFDIHRGGNLVVDTLILNNKALVLKLHDPSPNSNDFTIRTMKVDNNAAGWRLVELLRPDSLRLTVRGQIGRRAVPGPEPIKLLGDPKRQDIDVNLWWDGRRWPTPGEPLP